MSKGLNVNDLPSPKELGLSDLPSPEQINGVNLPGLTEEPGMGEAALRGIEQGATLGFGDEINGGAETALDTLLGKNPNLSILDTYRKHRNESRAAMEAAEQAHPIISGAANIAGGIAPALLTGGGSEALTAKQLASMGLKYGAAAGLGNSKADLSEGDVGGAIKDTAIGGALGAAISPVADKLMKVASPLANKVASIPGKLADLGPVSKLTEAMKQGFNRPEIATNSGQEAFGKELAGTMRGIGEDLQSHLSQVKNNKTQAILEDQPTMDISNWVDSADQMYDSLRKTSGRDKASRSELDQIKDLIDTHIHGDEAENIAGIGTNPTLQEVESLKAALGALGSAPDRGGLKTSAGRALADRLITPLSHEESLLTSNMQIPEGFQPLGKAITDANPKIADLNAQLHSGLESQKILPDLTDINNLTKGSVSGVMSRDQVEKFFSGLPKELQDKYRDKLTDLAKAQGTVESINAAGPLAKGLTEKVLSKASYGGANWLGRGGRIASDAAKNIGTDISGGLGQLYKMAPDDLRLMANRITSYGGDKYEALGRIINDASNKDQVGRNALFFALQQNPEYRAILKDVGNKRDENVPGQ